MSDDSLFKDPDPTILPQIPATVMDITQPSNVLVFIVFYAPIIIAICVLVSSFVFQHFKGLIYLGFLLAVSVAREYAYKATGGSETKPTTPVCNIIEYSKLGNNTYSTFMLAFTFVYMCMPMYMNSSTNWLVLGAFVAMMGTDIFVRHLNKCITSYGLTVLNIICGLFSGILIVGLMSLGGSHKHLFFNETQSDKVVCSRPKKQQFKCQVYKNGKLVG